jgi:hypothetical protein
VATATPGNVDISTITSTNWAFTNNADGTTVNGISKTNTGCTTGQAFSIGNLSPNPPVTVRVTASAPSGSGGTVTSTNLVTVTITQ